MRYKQSLQEKVIKESITKTTYEISQEYNIPEHIIRKWLFLDMPEEQLKVRVRQKFYNLMPAVESQITGYLSNHDYIVCGISDEEWEEVCKYISRIIFNTVFNVYKAAQLEKVCRKSDLTPDGKHLSKPVNNSKSEKYVKFEKALNYLPFDDERINC